MPGIILQSKWSDTHGVRYKLDIFDDEVEVDTLTPFDIVFGSIIVADEGSDNDPFKRVIPKSCTWTMLLESSNYNSTQTTAVRSFYNELSDSYEGRFFARVRKVGGNNDIIFQGKVLPDVGDLTLTMHEEFKVTSICGLKDLFNIEYKSEIIAGQYNDQPLPFTEHFSRILKLNIVVPFFNNSTAAIFSTSQHWTNNRHDEDDDIFRYSHRRNSYYEQISPTFRRFKTAGEVLTDLLTGFNARIYQAKGIFQIEQLSYQDNHPVKRRGYDIDGVELIGEGGAPYLPNKKAWYLKNNNPIEILQYPVVKRLPPFKAIRLKQNKGYYNVWNGLSLKWPLDAGPKSLGQQLSEGQQMAAELRFDIKPTIPTEAVGNILIKFKVKFGDFWLQPYDEELLGTNSIVSIVDQSRDSIMKPVRFSWSPVEVEILLQIVCPPTFLRPNESRKFKFWWVSDEVPENGELSWEITHAQAFRRLFENEGNVIESVEILPESKIFISEQGLDAFSVVPEQVILTEINDIRNTVVYDESLSYYDYGGTIIRPDGTTGLTNEIIHYRKTPFPPPFENIFPTLQWWKDPDMDDELPIQQLMMRSILTMRSKPNKVVNLTMIHILGDILQCDDIYVWQPDVYLPIKSAHNLSTGEYTFSLWMLNKDYSPWTTETDITIPEQDVFIKDTSDPVRFGDTPSGIVHFEEFFNVNDDFVVPDYSLNYLDWENEDFMRRNFFVVINGVKQRYVANVVPVNGQWTIDPADEFKLKFFKGRNPVAWIEFTTYF